MATYEINLEQRYRFPSEIEIIYYNNSILVVSPLTANWIVLESSPQLCVFNYFREGHSLREALANDKFNEQDVNYVVTQVEARRFNTKKVHNVTDDNRSLHLYLTNKCNLSCPHCYMFSGPPNVNELTTTEIIKLINDYKNFARGTSITFSGGEPTIHTDFQFIVKTTAELGLGIKVLTNGTFLLHENVVELAKYISSVQISIDGFSEESNSIIRGKGHFQKSLDIVESFLDCGVETSIAVTPPFEMLKKHLDDYASFAIQISEKYMNKPFSIKFAEEIISGRNIKPSKAENEEYGTMISRILKQMYNEDYKLITFVETMRNDVILNNCMFGELSVASNGDVYLCPEIGALTAIANIRTSSFPDILDKAFAAENATSISKLKPCNECALRYICGGGCRIKEFPTLVNMRSFVDVDYDNIPPRKCNSTIKNNFYNLMIQSNEYLYST